MKANNSLTNKQTGREGESLASAFLEKKGFKVLDRNFVSGKYEIDLICEFKQYIVFIEVKTRNNARLEPELAVNRSKQTHIARAAESYMRFKKLNKETRFDIVAINHANGITEITHFADAFYPVYYK